MSSHTDGRIDVLAGVGLFATCTRKELGRIAANTTEITIPAGRTVCQEGKLGEEAFVIVVGSATVSIGEREAAVLGRGDLFGEMAFLDGGPRVATVTATTALRVLVLTRTEFQAVMAEVPAVARQVLAVLGERLRLADHALFAQRPIEA